MGTRLDVVDGVLTGRIDGPFCYGTGKLEALERQVGRIDLSSATAYADSGSDVPLLSRCGQPVAINPESSPAALGPSGRLAHPSPRLTHTCAPQGTTARAGRWASLAQ